MGVSLVSKALGSRRLGVQVGQLAGHVAHRVDAERPIDRLKRQTAARHCRHTPGDRSGFGLVVQLAATQFVDLVGESVYRFPQRSNRLREDARKHFPGF